MNDSIYMKRCLDLALLGLGKVSPNPMVGSLIIYKNRIVGEGWHQKYGEAHAEVNAIIEALNYFNLKYPNLKTENSNKAFQDSTLYVSLEPCSHFGKTPPCSDLILFHKIGSVVIGCKDSNPLVGGRGIEKLLSNGIPIRLGILEKECRYLNRRFFTSLEKKRPYIILKWAETQNRFMAPLPYRPYWISSELGKRLNHRWRTEEDSILVGKNTAILDNPRLSSRLWTGKNPKRILIDWNLETPQTQALYNKEAYTFIFNGKESKMDGQTQFIQIENKEYLLQFLLFQLYLNNIQSTIVEGGAQTLQEFINFGLWDEVRIIRSSQDNIPGSSQKEEKGLPSPLLPISSYLAEEITLGTDTLRTYYSSEIAKI